MSPGEQDTAKPLFRRIERTLPDARTIWLIPMFRPAVLKPFLLCKGLKWSILILCGRPVAGRLSAGFPGCLKVMARVSTGSNMDAERFASDQMIAPNWARKSVPCVCSNAVIFHLPYKHFLDAFRCSPRLGNVPDDWAYWASILNNHFDMRDVYPCSQAAPGNPTARYPLDFGKEAITFITKSR